MNIHSQTEEFQWKENPNKKLACLIGNAIEIGLLLYYIRSLFFKTHWLLEGYGYMFGVGRFP